MTVLESFDPVATVPAGTIPLRRRVRSRAVRGWLAAVAVYMTAAFHRSSLGVAGLDAVERFGISSGALSIFVLLQLGVYAAMQVPTGILVDRYGPRCLLLWAGRGRCCNGFLTRQGQPGQRQHMPGHKATCKRTQTDQDDDQCRKNIFQCFIHKNLQDLARTLQRYHCVIKAD
jgi:hypothetical protein